MINASQAIEEIESGKVVLAEHELIEDYGGIGKPEPLKNNLTG